MKIIFLDIDDAVKMYIEKNHIEDEIELKKL